MCIRDRNWIKRISGVNGTTVRFLSPGNNGLSENFTFSSVTVKEQIAEIFANGIDFAETNSAGESVSWIVEVGDMFVAQNGNTFYLVVVKEVNETPDNNDDNYVVDIQF